MWLKDAWTRQVVRAGLRPVAAAAGHDHALTTQRYELWFFLLWKNLFNYLKKNPNTFHWKVYFKCSPGRADTWPHGAPLAVSGLVCADPANLTLTLWVFVCFCQNGLFKLKDSSLHAQTRPAPTGSTNPPSCGIRQGRLCRLWGPWAQTGAPQPPQSSTAVHVSDGLLDLQSWNWFQLTHQLCVVESEGSDELAVSTLA